MLPTPSAPVRRSPRPSWTWLAVLGCVLLGAALRLWGNRAGAPFRMGVDEPVILSTALRMLRTGDLHPHFFDYGGLTLYLHTATAALAFLAGAMAGRWNHLDAVWEGDLLAAGRTVTALIGAATILLVARIGLRWGPAVAVLAALTMAVLPTHVREAHFILTDTPLTFFVTLALLLSIRAVERPHLPAIAAAGLAVGLATAVKYNGGLALLLPALAALALPAGRRLAGVTTAVAAWAAAFLVCAPYTILDLPAFLNGMGSLMQSYNQSRPLTESMSNYLAYLRNGFTWPGVLPTWLGYGALAVVAGGLVALLRQPGRRRAGLLVAVFSIVFFTIMSTQTLQFGRYLMPMGPMLSLGLAAGIIALCGRLRSAAGRQLATAGLALVLLTPPAASAISWNLNNQRTTTAEQAARWLTDHAETGDRIVVEATLLHLPPGLVRTTTASLVTRSVEDYRRDGVTYLVASSVRSDRYYADPAANRDAIAAHHLLLAWTEPVASFVPTSNSPGATVTILRVRPDPMTE